MDDGLRVRIIRDGSSTAGAHQHRYGRSPRVVLPDCVICARPLDLIFEFDLRDPRLAFLRLGGMERLLVVSCLGCDLPYAGQLHYRPVGQSIEVLTNDGTTSFGSLWQTALPPCAVELAPIPAAELPTSYDSEQDWLEAVQFAEPPKHQLGGPPLWVQDETEVRCVGCEAPMRFLGQVASETWPSPDPQWEAGHMFGDMGMIYVHFCDACRNLATGGACY